jgi:hypothetical protein
MGIHRDRLSRYGTFRCPVILSSQRLRQTRRTKAGKGALGYADVEVIVPCHRLQWFPDY